MIKNPVHRYCLATLLAAFYLGSAVGIFSSFYLGFHRTSFQESIIRSMPSQAEKLVFSTRDYLKIKWIDKEKEFEWNNKLYDVSKIEKTKKGFDIFCVNDSLEEAIIAMVDQWKKSNTTGGKTKAIFQPQFCNSLHDVDLAPGKDVRTNFFFSTYLYTAPRGKAPSPPPKAES